MGGLFKSDTVNQSAPAAASLRVSTSSYGRAIPLVYGRTRVAANLIWYGDFRSVEHTSTQSAGGKGGGADIESTEYTYECACLLGLATGPVESIGAVWIGKNRYQDQWIAAQTLTATENFEVSAGLQFTVSHQDDFVADVSVRLYGSGMALQRVVSDPADMQYTEADGVYTFNVAQEGAPLAVQYRYTQAAHTEYGLERAGFSFFEGGPNATAFGYLETHHPAEALYYPELAYLASGLFDLGNDAGLPTISAEIQSPVRASPTLVDANPADVLRELLLAAGVVPDLIDGLEDYASACLAQGLLISPAYTEQAAARELIARLLAISNADMLVSEGLFRIVPLVDAEASAHGETYTPDLTPAYDLTDDDFLPGGDAPVECSRRGVADVPNTIRVKFSNRQGADGQDRDYTDDIAEACDLAAAEAYGARLEEIEYKEICDADVARRVAQLNLQRALYTRNTYSFRLGWNYARLEPGDLVTLTDAGLGLARQLVRVVSIEESTDGVLAIEAEELPIGLASAASYPTQTTGGYQVDFGVDPGDAADPVLFVAPNALSAPHTEVWLATSGGPDWGGCEVWVSDTGSSFKRVGKINARARHGVLSQALPVGSDPDTAHTLAVSLDQSMGELTDASQSDADNHLTLCYVDGELLAYGSVELTGAGEYDLAYLRRGLHGSSIVDHASGAQFARLDEAVFKYRVPTELRGKTLYIKLRSFNRFGRGLQALDIAPVFSVNVLGIRPPAPTTLTATGGYFLIDLAWGLPDFPGLDGTEIWQSATNNRNQATLLTYVKAPGNRYTHANLDSGERRYYWARCYDTGGNISDWMPGITAGVEGRTRIDATELINQLSGAITKNQLYQDLGQKIDSIDTMSATQLEQLLAEAAARDGQRAALVRTARAEWTLMQLTGDDGSFASARLELEARHADYLNYIYAGLVSEQQTRASADGAIASDITTLQTTVNGHTTIIQLTAESVDGIQGKYAVKIDNNGFVTGFGLISENNNGEVVSGFYIRADRFAIGPTTGGSVIEGELPDEAIPFMVLTAPTVIDGVTIPPGAYIKTAFVSHLTADKIVAESLSAIVADLGTITAGRAQNAANTNFIDFNATGSQPFIKVGDSIEIKANGEATFSGVVLSRALSVATGSQSFEPGWQAVGANAPGDEVYSVWVDTGYAVPTWGSGGDYNFVGSARLVNTGLTINSPFDSTQPAAWSVEVVDVMPVTHWFGGARIYIRLAVRAWKPVHGGSVLFHESGNESEPGTIEWKLLKMT